MSSLVLITSQCIFGKALEQVAKELMGKTLEFLPCKAIIAQPYGDVWIKGEDGYYAVGSELRRRWESGEISCAIIGPLDNSHSVAGPRLFTAFLRRFYRCLMPVVGIEIGDTVKSPELPSGTYARLPKMSVALLFDVLRGARASASSEIGPEAEAMVSKGLWRVLTHDLGTMADKALAAGDKDSVYSPRLAARSLLYKYQDLRLMTSFLSASAEHQHLLPERALDGLENACRAVINDNKLLAQEWQQRIEDYNGKCALAIESWQ